MNILMLGWELPPHNSGGLGVACYHLSKALALKGATIDFVVPYKAAHPGAEFMNIHAAVNLSPLHKGGLMGAYDGKYLRQIGLDEADAHDLNDLRGVQKRYAQFVEQMARNKKPDIIHTHDWLTMEAGIRAKQITGAPLIAHVHATEFDRSGTDSGNPLIHDIEYQGLMMADRVIAVSNFTKNIIVHKYHIPASKIEVVHNAIDADELNDGYAYDQRTYKYIETLKNEGYTIVSVITRFTIQKGLTHFLRAAALASQKYHKLAFLLVGSGEQRDELVQLAADLGIADKTFFTGFVRGKKWRDAYSVSDVFVMSSVSEPFGIAALEAAHHNNALCITYQSGVGEVLRNVLRYDFWDVNKLADQIIGIASSRALKSELKQNVSYEYARLSWHDAANKVIEIYKSPAAVEVVV